MFEGLFQPMHLIVIFGIALLVFGPRKLPELGKGLGESIRGFKAADRMVLEGGATREILPLDSMPVDDSGHASADSTGRFPFSAS